MINKNDFPALVNNKGIVYLDSAASSIKPKCVIDAIDDYYNNLSVNVNRGVYKLSYKATDMYEETRKEVAKFINCKEEEVVFTRGASASLNLVASSYKVFINEGDEIITSVLEHHSSIMPWMEVAREKKAVIKYIPLDEDNKITVENFKKVLTDKTRVVAINHVSNVIGYTTPVEEIIKLAHEKGAIVSIDGAQSIPHMPIDVKKMDCDFFSFSAHKMLGPTGLGVLYGKHELLEKMPPVEFGGDMADMVYLEEMTFKEAPFKFETGTPLISEVIAFKEALKYLEDCGMDNIRKHELELKKYAKEVLSNIEGVKFYNLDSDSGLITFNIEGVHPHDASTIFDKNNVCVRAGYHCAQLITRYMNEFSTIRASLYLYNTFEDIDKLKESIIEARDYFNKF